MTKPWPFRPVVIVGSGPSLTAGDCDYVDSARRGERVLVIAVNNAYTVLQWPDIVYAADAHWWRHYESDVRVKVPYAERYSSDAAIERYDGTFVPATNGVGLAAPTVGQIMRGTSSGFQAVGLAVQLGARHIILVGFDCKFGEDGAEHFHGRHNMPNYITPPVAQWVHEMDSLAEPCAARGIRLVNCSGDTATQKLLRAKLSEELFGWQ